MSLINHMEGELFKGQLFLETLFLSQIKPRRSVKNDSLPYLLEQLMNKLQFYI